MKGRYQRILIFNVNWIGDVVFSTATIRNIRRRFPKSYIACAIPSRCYPVLKGNPHLDEVIIFDEKERHRGLFEKMRFIGFLKRKQFDVVFLLHRSLSRALICRLAGIPARIGYDTKRRGFLLTKKIIPPRIDSMHRIDYYLNVFEQAGFKAEDRYPEFFVDAQDEAFVKSFLEKKAAGTPAARLLAALNPGGNWLPKRWPPAYWAELADRLAEELGARVVITGAQSDSSLVREITNRMKTSPVVACGAFNLKQLAALARQADFFITADTGPLHIANAAGAKHIIALFGPTAAELTGPFPLKNVSLLQKDTGCVVPCYKVFCKDNRCMKEVLPVEVLEEIKKLLKAAGGN